MFTKWNKRMIHLDFLLFFLYALCCCGDILCNIISSSLVFFCTLFIARQKLMNRLKFVLNSESQLKPARIHTNANHINIVRPITFSGCLNRQPIIEYCFIIFSSSILLVYDCNKLLLYYIDRGGVKKVLGILKKFYLSLLDCKFTIHFPLLLDPSLSTNPSSRKSFIIF